MSDSEIMRWVIQIAVVTNKTEIHLVTLWLKIQSCRTSIVDLLFSLQVRRIGNQDLTWYYHQSRVSLDIGKLTSDHASCELSPQNLLSNDSNAMAWDQIEFFCHPQDTHPEGWVHTWYSYSLREIGKLGSRGRGFLKLSVPAMPMPNGWSASIMATMEATTWTLIWWRAGFTSIMFGPMRFESE